jgi:hypothetical protein
MYWNLCNQLIKRVKGDIFNTKIYLFGLLTSALMALVSMTLIIIIIIIIIEHQDFEALKMTSKF